MADARHHRVAVAAEEARDGLRLRRRTRRSRGVWPRAAGPSVGVGAAVSVVGGRASGTRIGRRTVVPASGRCQLRVVPVRRRDRAVYPAPSCRGTCSRRFSRSASIPKKIINDLSPFGEIGLFLIIFAESGLLIGFFLPGDSLLFTAGLLANQGKLNLAAILIGCFVAAVARRPGRASRSAEGGTAPVPAPGLEAVQTGVRRPHRGLLRAARRRRRSCSPASCPSCARSHRSSPASARCRRTFISFNVIGGFIWAVGVTLAGYLLADAIGDSIDKYLFPIIAGDHRRSR